MNKAEKLKQKYLEDLANLQTKCKHNKQSEWMENYWAPGHSSGFEVKVCNECGKPVNRRAIPKSFIDDQLM